MFDLECRSSRPTRRSPTSAASSTRTRRRQGTRYDGVDEHSLRQLDVVADIYSRTYTVAYGDHHAIVVVLLYTPGARDGPFYGLFRNQLCYFDVDSAECFATASEKPAVGPIVETLFEIGQTLGAEVSSSALPHVISIVETTVAATYDVDDALAANDARTLTRHPSTTRATRARGGCRPSPRRRRGHPGRRRTTTVAPRTRRRRLSRGRRRARARAGRARDAFTQPQISPTTPRVCPAAAPRAASPTRRPPSSGAASGPRRSVRGYRRALPVLGPIEPLDLTVHRKTSHGLSLVYLRLGRVQTGLEVVFIGTRK